MSEQDPTGLPDSPTPPTPPEPSITPPAPEEPSTTPPDPVMSTESPRAASNGKPLKWLPAGLISLLAGLIVGIIMSFAAVLLIGLPILVGVLSSSAWAGIALGIPLCIGFIVLWCYAASKVNIKLLEAFDYQAPGFWQTLMALLLGNLVGSFIMLPLSLFLGILAPSASSDSGVGTALALQGLLLLVSFALQIVCVGFALEKLQAVTDRVAKIVSIVLVGLFTLGTVAVVTVFLALGASLFDSINNRDSANNSAAISSLTSAEQAVSSYYTLHNESFGKSPEALAEGLGREGSSGLTWIADPAGAGTMPGKASDGGDPNKVFIEQVAPGRFGGVLLCVASKGDTVYCSAVLGNGPTQRFTLPLGEFAGEALLNGGVQSGSPATPASFKAPGGWKEGFQP